MKSLLISLLVLSAAASAQEAIPAGTVLPAELSTSLDSGKSTPGQVITARIMQDVPLPAGRIPAGARIVGHIVSVAPAMDGSGTEVALQFDALRFFHRSIPITVDLRALASMMEVEDAQIPSTGTDRGTPWAWMTTNQIGGEVVYGQGGPVMNGSRSVGGAAPGGVLVHLSAKPGSMCQGETGDDDRLQALWVFASDACGLYGFRDLEITHAGRTNPVGQIRISSTQGRLHIQGGSGLLLRVIAQERPLSKSGGVYDVSSTKLLVGRNAGLVGTIGPAVSGTASQFPVSVK